MTRTRPAVCAVLLGVACLHVGETADARESNGTPAAQALLGEGVAATRAGKHTEAVASFRKAIEADPDFVDAHQRFIETTQRIEMPESRTPTIPTLLRLYERWAKQHPKRAVYRWALGFMSHDPTRADAFFKEALAIDPAFARAHVQLARNADLRGDWVAQRAHLKAAVDSNPDEPRYLLRYADAHRNSDPTRFQQLALSVVAKFPQSPYAAEALYSLSTESSNPERRTYLERIRANYPADKFTWGSMAMSRLYGELTTPAEALSVARDMVKWVPASQTWAQRVVQQERLARTAALIAERRFTEALDMIQNTTRPTGTHGTTWVLLKAEAAAGAGQLDQAYTALVESVAAVPDERVQAALVKFGSDLRKTSGQINADVWRIRDAKATPATAFQLTSSRDGKPVRLSDYRGRVVLVAFWFPG